MSQDTLDVAGAISVEPSRPEWTVDGSASLAPEREWTPGVLSNGLLAGFVGYAVVAVFFALTSVVGGHSPFYIAALLGSDLFFGGGGAPATIEPGPVFAYNGVHMVAFLLAGLVFSWLAKIAAQAPQGWYFSVIAVLFGAGHVSALPFWFGPTVQAALPLWLVVIATTLAVLAMGTYLWLVNPGIRSAMHEPDE